MRNTIATLLLAALAAAPIARAAEVQREDLEKAIRSYLMEHPETIIEALRKYEDQQKAASLEKSRAAIRDNEQMLLRDANTPWIGSAQPEITVVQFFDYHCGYCKRARTMVAKLESTPGVRVIHKELPILGASSLLAARAALAAHEQGKYREMHEALLAENVPITLPGIRETAKRLGLDVAALETAMNSAATTAALNANQALAMSLGIASTPSFVIGSELLVGVPGETQLEQALNRARIKDKVRGLD